jgi:hypothetical protein
LVVRNIRSEEAQDGEVSTIYFTTTTSKPERNVLLEEADEKGKDVLEDTHICLSSPLSIPIALSDYEQGDITEQCSKPKHSTSSPSS